MDVLIEILLENSENIFIVTTPPEAFPYLVEDRLFKTSIFSMSSKGILSTCDWPSGVVSGIPSRIILTPDHTKKFINALGENLDKYERSFGKIKNFQKEVIPISFGPKGEA